MYLVKRKRLMVRLCGGWQTKSHPLWFFCTYNYRSENRRSWTLQSGPLEIFWFA